MLKSTNSLTKHISVYNIEFLLRFIEFIIFKFLNVLRGLHYNDIIEMKAEDRHSKLPKLK